MQNSPAKPVPQLTYPIVWLGNPLRKPKKLASPRPWAIPTNELARTATTNQNMETSLSKTPGEWYEANAIKAKAENVKMQTAESLVM